MYIQTKGIQQGIKVSSNETENNCGSHIDTEVQRFQTLCKITLPLVLFLTCIYMFSSWKTEPELDILHQMRKKEKEVLTISNKPNIKKTQIAYLKTPKTGSSTLASIFLRFGFKNNLRMYLPKFSFVNNTLKKDLLKRRIKFDIFVIHTIYDHHFFTHIVKDPAIIGQIRDPQQRIISRAFFSMRKLKRFKNMSAKKFINDIISNTRKYHKQNILSRFFGIAESVQQNKQKTQKELEKINNEFLLILILEKIDESLILMKRLLNWSFVDVIHGKMKENHHETVSLNVSQKEHFRRTNKLDIDIYDFFLNQLNKKIEKAGTDFKEEVAYFRYLSYQTKIFCEEQPAKEKISFSQSRWDSGWFLLKEECNMIYKNDIGRLKTMFANAKSHNVKDV